MENNTNDPLEEVDTVISSPEKPENGSGETSNNEDSEGKGLGKIVSIIIVLIFIASGIFLWKSGYLTIPTKTTTQVDTHLVIEPRELTISMNNSAQIRAYLQGAITDSREEITDQIEWYTNDPDLFTIGNVSVKGQVTSRSQEGEGFITMIYGEQTEIVPVTVTRALLKAECYPLLAEKWTKEGIKTAKVGDEIDWMGSYIEIGSPHYDYKWTGAEGLDSDDAIASIVYKTPGLKEVHFWTKDTAGSVAEADCSITITK